MADVRTLARAFADDPTIGDAPPAVVRRIPEALAWEFEALAVALDGDVISVAFANAPTPAAIARIERATELRVRAVRAPADQVRKGLSHVFGRAAVAPGRGIGADAPAVRAVDALHERAFFERCSDIHVEPQAGGARVRFRIDGFLREVESFPDALALAVTSRIKVLAGMDIAEKRQPQDGRYSLEIAGHVLDARISSMPARDGEKIVVRLLDHHAQLPSLDDIGMAAEMQDRFRETIERSCGFVVVCGPTGSGKTTTLYAALSHLNAPERNLCTVEDPVEQAIAGVTQVQVNARAGVSFASVLRALLRQDPNVIMVGEMRDAETAETAIAASLAGQLVLATLHSNDAPRTVERLVELGVSRSSLAAGLSAVVAQRLVRLLCGACKRPTEPSPADVRRYAPTPGETFFGPGGCERCSGVGYRGRIGIFELLAIDDVVRDAIVAGASSVAVGTLAPGYRTMTEDGLAKCRAGLTSLAEVTRVAVRGIAA